MLDRVDKTEILQRPRISDHISRIKGSQSQTSFFQSLTTCSRCSTNLDDFSAFFFQLPRSLVTPKLPMGANSRRAAYRLYES